MLAFSLALLSLVSTISAVGEDCANPVTLWDSYYCSIAQNPAKYQSKCFPVRALPQNATSLAAVQQVRGVVIGYHGFTGCPDAFSGISEVLTREGYIVITPLLPGQGINIGFGCQMPGTCVGIHNYNPSEIPTAKTGYFDWSRQVLDMVNEQVALIPDAAKGPNFQVQALGLSVGGALASYAAQLANSPIKRVLNANPYYSSTVPVLDFAVKQCDDQSDPSACVANLLQDALLGNSTLDTSSSGSFARLLGGVQSVTRAFAAWSLKQTLGNIATHSYDQFLITLWETFSAIGDNKTLQSLPLLSSEYSWNDSCFQNSDRGGICSFQYRHLIALQSFVEHTVGNMDRIDKSVLYADIHSDMDGYARDSVSFAVVQSLQSRGVIASRCHFPSKCAVADAIVSASQDNNHCGVPHSLFSRAESTFNPPGVLYWEPSLFANIVSFFNGLSSGVGTTADPLDIALCASTSATLNAGGQFQAIGPKYLANARLRYGGK
ncbi:hypothetical protein HDU91_004776 [Kappamyces sp. JEL0680]|nr:hypothetical protein HDU91_004776 [Kappamyces sp. JEL0680]